MNTELHQMRKLRQRSIVYAEDVFKFYGNKRILDNVDFAIEPREFVTLVGPSGCGKSTFLRLILGQEFPEPHPETIFEVGGQPVGYPDRDRGIVYQTYTLLPHLTVLENVMLGMLLPVPFLKRFGHKREIRRQAMEYLKYVNLADAADKYPKELSGGMRQRVAIAQALIMKPTILMMDEPFGALDPGIREDMQVLILELWEKHKMTILFVTHDLEEAVFLGTRIAVLSQNYLDERCPDFQRGAKFIHDEQLKAKAASTDWKKCAEYAEKVQEIRTSYFETDYTPHVSKFNLNHPNSFQTLREKELNGLAAH
jgi:NitT/TauT family transport system ATP-binding protein